MHTTLPKNGVTRPRTFAIQLSDEFVKQMAGAGASYQLLCFYEDNFFLNPRALTDPEMGEFSNERVLELLRAAGANSAKTEATGQFLHGFEDYEAASKPGSRSEEFLRAKLKELPPPLG